MARIALFVAITCLGATVLSADRGIAGQWRAEFATPLGQRGVNLTILQRGGTLSGHAIDEYGEYELKGRFAGAQVTIGWAVPENGRMLAITMRGTLDGDTIRGTARLGDVGEGAFSARRTGDAGVR